MGFVVAVDGPAGSGKGTLAKKISKEMGLINIDTGAMYRCVALEMLNNNVQLDEEEKIKQLLNNINIDFKVENNIDKVFLNGKDVTKEIRSEKVTKIVSQVSAIIIIRKKLVELQRKMKNDKNIIMEGRDIGTYVFPDAKVKIYLDGSLEVRANRRYKENLEKGINMTYDEVINNMKMRDENDKNKVIGALKVADDAIVIDTTNLTIDEVKEKVKNIIKSKIN